MLLFVFGIDSDNDQTLLMPNEEVLKQVTEYRTNKIVFTNEHNHFFDLMDKGIILVIPIFDSINSMSDEWEYGQTFEVLIICSNAGAYSSVGISQIRDHVKQAEHEDVEKAATILSVFTKILADSLSTHWDAFFSKTGDDVRRGMLKRMYDEITPGGKVRVPVFTTPEGGSQPKLYKINYGELWKNGGTHFTPDPFLLAIKAAVNLSHLHYSKEHMKLLPACSFDSPTQTKETWDILGMEIPYVSDEESESDSSDITF